MAMTNAKGYFCDVPCGFSNPMCNNFFCAGCASAGMPLRPNTEYPEYTKVAVTNERSNACLGEVKDYVE